MRRQMSIVACLVMLFPVPGSSQTAPADSDASVTVQCPSNNAGTPVSVSGEVSFPQGDTTDAVNYTVEVPAKGPGNTGIWELKVSYKCAAPASATRFSSSSFNKTGCITNNRPLFASNLTPSSNKTGRVTVQAASGPGTSTQAVTNYTLTFYCGIYRAN